MGNLTSLALSYNKINMIPNGVCNTSNLISLHLDDNIITGSIPICIDGLVNIQHIYLYNNLITGMIPINTCNLRNLKILNIEKNSLSGPIPSCINLLSNL